MDFDRKRSFQIGHFRVPKTLTFKVRPSAQPFLWKWVLFAWVWKIISISKAGHLYSFWYRGPGEPGNGLFATLEAKGKLGRVNFGKDFWERYYGQAGGGGGGGIRPTAEWRVPSNDSRNNCGAHFGSSCLLVSKEVTSQLMVQIFYDIYSYFALFRYFRGWFVRRMLEKSKAKVTSMSLVGIEGRPG